MPMLLYVPAMTPMMSTHKKTRIVSPPTNKSASSVNSSVRLVFSERPMLSMMLTFAFRSSARFG